MSLVGIELLTIDARIVIASVDTYLRFAEATNRLDLYEKGGKDLPGLMGELTEKGTHGGAKGKTKGVLDAAKETVEEVLQERSEDREERREPRRRRRGVPDTSWWPGGCGQRDPDRAGARHP